MKNYCVRWRVTILALSVCCAALKIHTPLASAATPSAAGAAQTTAALEKEFKEIDEMTSEVAFQSTGLDSKQLRARAGPQAIEALTPQFDRMTQFAAKSPEAEKMARIHLLFITARIAYWGQKEAIASIETMAASPVPATAARGKIAQGYVTFREAGDDAAAQIAAVETFQPLVTSYPTDDTVARGTYYLVNHLEMPVKAAHRLNVLVAGMKAPAAVAYTKLPGRIGEPVVFAGASLKGSDFSTAKWKGKVIMVDFWATWCPPCRASIPEVIERYNKYHDQGFEVLGVDCDGVKKDLTSYLSDNSGMVWPQLFKANSAGKLHPLAYTFEIGGVPTVYLIDRNGILREYECGRPLRIEMITKALAETADEPVSPAPKKETSAAR